MLLNRPYRLFSFTQWPRFHVKYLLMFCTNSSVENYFVIEHNNRKKQIRPGKTWEYNLYLPLT
jgi:hypothetical protein